MIEWYVVLAPLLVLPIVLLFGFVGCYTPATLTSDGLNLRWEGKIRDRVGQGKLALAPDGSNDGTVTVTLNLSGGRSVTGLKLDSYLPNDPSPVGTWDTDINNTHFVLGASTGLDDRLLNDPGNAAVNFAVDDGAASCYSPRTSRTWSSCPATSWCCSRP